MTGSNLNSLPLSLAQAFASLGLAPLRTPLAAHQASPLPGSSSSRISRHHSPEASASQIRSAPGPRLEAADTERVHHASCPLTPPALDAVVPLLIYAIASEGHTWLAASGTVPLCCHECGYLPPVK